MATLTYKLPLTDNGNFQALVDGDTYASFGLVCLGGKCALVVADSAPANNVTDFIPINASDTREFVMDIPEGYIAYVRSTGNDTVVAGYRIPR